MTKRTKWINLCVLGLFITLFVSMTKAEQEPVTVTMWDWFVASDAYLKTEIQMFEEKYPYIKVNRVRQAQVKFKDMVVLAQRSGNLPDIIALPQDQQLNWMKNGFLAALNKYITPEFINRFPKGSFINGVNMYDDHIYSYPTTGTDWWTQLYVNPAVFKKYGIVDKQGNPAYPKTWAEIKKDAKLITERSKQECYGFGIAYKPDHLYSLFLYEWAKVAGARAGAQDMFMAVDYKVGRYNYTSKDVLDGYLKMFKFLLDMKKDGSLYPKYMSLETEILLASFADGKLAMMPGGVWNQNLWASNYPQLKDYDVLMVPPYDETGYKALLSVPMAKASNAMTSQCKHPDEAWKLLDWLGTQESGSRYVRAGLGVSIFPSANVRSNAKTKPYGQYLEISGKYTLIGPNPLARNPELSNVTVKISMPVERGVFWGILSGQIPYKDIPKALKDLESRKNSALKEGMDEAVKKGFKVSMDDLSFPDWNPLKNYEAKKK